MRKIRIPHILVFLFLTTTVVGLGVMTTRCTVAKIPLGNFRGIILLLSGICLTYVYAFAMYRIWMKLVPLRPGIVDHNSEQEFAYHIHLLFFLIFFYPIIRCGAVPVPLMRLVYLALGADLGENTYSSGLLLDPIFIHVGSNTLIGQGSVITPHVIENDQLAHHPIRIGSNVTIGTNATILSDVRIGDNAIIAAGAVVRKGTVIGTGEVWGGVPARLLKKKQPLREGSLVYEETARRQSA